MRAPTQIRLLNDREWSIVKGVYGDTLPYHWRIWVTDGNAVDGRAFVIPTSALSGLTAFSAVQSAIVGVITGKTGKLGDKAVALSNKTGLIGRGPTLSQISGVINLGYLMNVGPRHFPNMAASDASLLVHEMAHVWQGKNDKSSMTFVQNSIMNQVRSDTRGTGHGAAYSYTPGGNWSSYGVEQQASIIEDWYKAGMPQSGDLWPYIRDYVRKGKT